MVAELDEEIEDAFRHRPAEHAIAVELGRRVEGDEQNVRSGGVGWRRSELILPQSKAAPAPQLVSDQDNTGSGRSPVRVVNSKSTTTVSRKAESTRPLALGPDPTLGRFRRCGFLTQRSSARVFVWLAEQIVQEWLQPVELFPPPPQRGCGCWLLRHVTPPFHANGRLPGDRHGRPSDRGRRSGSGPRT